MLTKLDISPLCDQSKYFTINTDSSQWNRHNIIWDKIHKKGLAGVEAITTKFSQ